MAKAIAQVAEHRTASTASWILLAVSVTVITVLAISVPHLIGREGWLTGGLMMALNLSHIRVWGVVGRDPAKRDRLVLLLGGQPSKYRESFEKRFNELAGELETTLRTAERSVAEPIPA